MDRLDRGQRRAAAVALLLVLAFAWLGARGLWETDEGRYTAVALQMQQDGDWLLPHLFDVKPHVTKPPLTYWALAAALHLGGRHELAARLPNALAFLAAVWLVWRIARRLFPEGAWWPPLLYALSPLVQGGLLFVTTDTLLALWELVAMDGFVRAWDERRRGRGDGTAGLVQMGVGFGLAFLTKGPPGLLPLLGVLAFVLLERRRGRSVRLWCSGGLLLGLVLGGGWYALLLHHHPDLWRYWLGHEVMDRVASGAHHRNPQWYGGLLVYGPTLLVAALPGLWLLPGARRGARERWWRALSPPRWRDRPEVALPLLWLAIPLAVFLLARSRLPLYLLPLAAPLVLLLGWPLARRFPAITPGQRRGLAGWAVLLLAVRLVMAHLAVPQDSRRLARELRPLLPATVSRLVFVNANPYYGLRFYLDVPVEPVRTSRRGPWRAWGESYRTVREVLPLDDGGWVYVVPDRWWSRWEEQVTRTGRHLRLLGRVRDKRLVSLEPGEARGGD